MIKYGIRAIGDAGRIPPFYSYKSKDSIRMKLKKLFIGLVLATLLPSCSNDFAGDDDGKILENETTTYVRLSLLSDGSTRAYAEYENGTADESKVDQIMLVFFDAGRNYVGQSNVTVTDDNTIVNDGVGNTIDKVLTMVTPVNLPENINYPKYVVAFVNPTAKYADLAADKLEDLMTYIRSRGDISHRGYRTMNNSLFFNEDTKYSRFATEVDFERQFFETEEEAKNATNATIDIRVERMEAKVRLSTPLNEIKQDNPFSADAGIGTEKYTLEFVPEAWFVNGTEKRSFLLKNFREQRDNYLSGNMPVSDNGMHLDDVKTAFKANAGSGDMRFNYVNDMNNMRCYWAIDPTYFILASDASKLYPEISYDVNYEGINPGGSTYPLNYYSYAKMLEQQKQHQSTNYVKFNGNVKTHEYVLENTVSYATMTSTNAKASMASVVLLGHYMVKNKAGQVVFDGTVDDPAQSFYVRHDANSTKYVMISDKEAIDYFLERGGSTLYIQKVNAAGAPIAGSYEPLRPAHLRSTLYDVDYDDFELVYPDTEISGGRKLSEQWRTLVLRRNAENKFNDKILVYDASQDNGNGGYKKVSDVDIKDLHKRVFSTYGVLEKFSTGKAYFNIPLKHIWKAASTSNVFDPKTVVLGDYGVVRNHIYDLTINKIEGLATGIGDIEQPIVPPTENEQYYISTRIRVLQWRMVSQSVDL